MPTGYEVDLYRNIGRIADALEKIAAAQPAPVDPAVRAKALEILDELAEKAAREDEVPPEHIDPAGYEAARRGFPLDPERIAATAPGSYAYADEEAAARTRAKVPRRRADGLEYRCECGHSKEEHGSQGCTGCTNGDGVTTCDAYVADLDDRAPMDALDAAAMLKDAAARRERRRMALANIILAPGVLSARVTPSTSPLARDDLGADEVRVDVEYVVRHAAGDPVRRVIIIDANGHRRAGARFWDPS